MLDIYSLSEGLTYNNQLGKNIFQSYNELPGGELHFTLHRIDIKEQPIMLISRLNTPKDLIRLIMVGETLKQECVRFDVFIPYIPGGRQDRVEFKGEPFTLKIISNLINNIPYEKLFTYSPHSNVTLALLRNVNSFYLPGYWWQVINENIDQADDAWIIAPDEGASKRTFSIFKHLLPEFPNLKFAQALKIRNPKSGYIEGVNCLETDLKGFPVFVFDDICDGGRTFEALALDMVYKNSGKLYLAVDHGIFSRGTTLLMDHYSGIYSTNSILNEFENVKMRKL